MPIETAACIGQLRHGRDRCEANPGGFITSHTVGDSNKQNKVLKTAKSIITVHVTIATQFQLDLFVYVLSLELISACETLGDILGHVVRISNHGGLYL